MVVLTIVTQKNGETIFFDEPIPQVHFIRLISCSLYNSWDTLKKESIAILFDKTNDTQKISKIAPGHYNLENLQKLIDGLFEAHYNKLETQINNHDAILQIHNYGAKGINLTGEFAKALGLSSGPLKTITKVKSLTFPAAYFIHCDLINRNFNFVNNKNSDLLAKIDVRGKAYEKVRYDASPQQPIRDCSTSSHVNSTTISIRDQDGELFDFKGLPLEFELELN